MYYEYWLTVELIDWWIDWWLSWLFDWRLSDWLIDWWLSWLFDCRLIDWLIDRWLSWLFDWRLIDLLSIWLIDWLMAELIVWLSDWLMDWLSDWNMFVFRGNLPGLFRIRVISWQHDVLWILSSTVLTALWISLDVIWFKLQLKKTVCFDIRNCFFNRFIIHGQFSNPNLSPFFALLFFKEPYIHNGLVSVG